MLEVSRGYRSVRKYIKPAEAWKMTKEKYDKTAIVGRGGHIF